MNVSREESILSRRRPRRQSAMPLHGFLRQAERLGAFMAGKSGHGTMICAGKSRAASLSPQRVPRGKKKATLASQSRTKAKGRRRGDFWIHFCHLKNRTNSE